MEVNGQKSFQCPFDGCGKVFSKSSNLKQHERIHSGDKPFVCNICDRSFCQSGNLLKHKRSHENLSLKWNRQTSEKPFKCSFEGCERSFTAKSSLQTHFKTNHPDNSSVRLHYPTQHNPLIDGPPFICCMTTCKEIFLSKATPVEHLTTHCTEFQLPTLSSYISHHCMHPVCCNKYTLSNHENFFCEHMALWYPGLVAENRFLKNTLSTLINCVDSLQSINATVAEQMDLVTIKNELNRLTKPFGNPQPQNQHLSQQPLQPLAPPPQLLSQQPLTLLNPQHFMVQQQLQLHQQQHSVPFAQLSSYQHASHVGGNCAHNLPHNYSIASELSSIAQGWQAHQIENVDDDINYGRGNSSNNNSSCNSSGNSIMSSGDSSGRNTNSSSSSTVFNSDNNNCSRNNKRSYVVYHSTSNTHDNQSFRHMRYNPTYNSTLHNYVNPHINNNNSLYNNHSSNSHSNNNNSNSNRNNNSDSNTMHTVSPNTVEYLDNSSIVIVHPIGFPSHSFQQSPQYAAQQLPLSTLKSTANSTSSSALNISLSEAVEFVAVLFDEPSAAVRSEVKYTSG